MKTDPTRKRVSTPLESEAQATGETGPPAEPHRPPPFDPRSLHIGDNIVIADDGKAAARKGTPI